MCVEDLLNNFEQHVNIDFNNDVDNPELGTVQFCLKYVLIFVYDWF
jgi:hypothetical protein